MAFSEAAGFDYIPAFNMNETPQDMADFIEYAKGSADSEWGRRRQADGHPQPFKIRYLELGNEEIVDEAYFARFKPLAEAIWTKDPDIILVVGDFDYKELIEDPFCFTGSRISSLAGQQRILQLARQHQREVWFDVHLGTGGPLPDVATLRGMLSFTDALDRIADGADTKLRSLSSTPTTTPRTCARERPGDQRAGARWTDSHRHVCQRPPAGRPER